MNLIKTLGKFFEIKVSIPRIRRGKRQSLETLINEEASLLAMFIRGEKSDWIPRIKCARASDRNFLTIKGDKNGDMLWDKTYGEG